MTEKRFTEIISIQKVIDNKTGKEYDCLIDDELLKLFNELTDENQRLENEVKELTQKYVDEMESHACTYNELDSIKQTLYD